MNSLKLTQATWDVPGCVRQVQVEIGDPSKSEVDIADEGASGTSELECYTNGCSFHPRTVCPVSRSKPGPTDIHL